MTEFVPTLYVKTGCPSCFKVRLFLLEAGLIDQFVLREFAPEDANEAVMKAELAPHFENVTFPTVQFAPGEYQHKSDDIIARYAAQMSIDPASLPLFVAYADGLLPRLRQLDRENKEMKRQLEEAAEA